MPPYPMYPQPYLIMGWYGGPGWMPPPTPEDELAMLEEYKKMLEEDLKELQEELKGVEDRITELKQIISSGGPRRGPHGKY